MPAVSTTAQFTYELGILSDIQVAEALYTCERATLGWDGYNEVHVSIRMKGSPKLLQLTLQTAELARGMNLFVFFSHVINYIPIMIQLIYSSSLL